MMRKKQKTKRLAEIRRLIRKAARWYQTDKGCLPEFWSQPPENYIHAREVPAEKRKIGHYPYYVRSAAAIEDIAKKINRLCKLDFLYDLLIINSAQDLNMMLKDIDTTGKTKEEIYQIIEKEFEKRGLL
jgi:hypothetical protein